MAECSYQVSTFEQTPVASTIPAFGFNPVANLFMIERGDNIVQHDFFSSYREQPSSSYSQSDDQPGFSTFYDQMMSPSLSEGTNEQQNEMQ